MTRCLPRLQFTSMLRATGLPACFALLIIACCHSPAFAQYGGSHFQSTPQPSFEPSIPDSGFRHLPPPPTQRTHVPTSPDFGHFEDKYRQHQQQQNSSSRFRPRSMRGLIKIVIFLIALLFAAGGWAVRKINA
ncbi:MAG: hypothetical protein AAFN77_16475 [Planctomycetota bacterium]